MANGNFIEKKINNDNKPKQNIFFRFIKLIIWILIILCLIIYFNYQSFTKNNIISENQIINIKTGNTFEQLANKLKINKYYFKYYIKNNNPDFKLIVGDFKIKKDSKINDILISLKTPIIYNEINFTVLEGWNIYDIDKCLSNPEYFYINNENIETGCLYSMVGENKSFILTPIIKEGEYIKYVTNLEKINKLSEFFPFIKGLNSLEGFLYPDTYKINIKTTQINQIVIAQLENFETKIYNKYFLGENSKSNITNKEIEKIISLASIVEKEEKNSVNKPIVAGILKKRLDEGWMIGADATVCYPHKLTSNECRMVVSKYIHEKSEYNTRTMTGLPKTPIGNPNQETINATINYKKTPYYFYLHNSSTGKIYYAKTNAEHEANKKYMK